jgi:hypothetical protein
MGVDSRAEQRRPEHQRIEQSLLAKPKDDPQLEKELEAKRGEIESLRHRTTW